MHEIEKNRMNFIRRRHGALTYRSMALFVLAWIVVLSAVYGFLILGERLIVMKTDRTKAKLETLVKERDRQIKLVKTLSRERIGTLAKDDLKAALLSRPKWSDVLKALTRDIPPQVWLEALTMMAEEGGEKRLTMKGKAKSHRALTNFVAQIKSGGLFRQTALVETKQVSDASGIFLEYRLKTTPFLERFR